MKTTLATALLLAAFLGTDDLAKQLRSKEAKERLAAVAAVREQKPEDAVALLTKALDDSDWEVVERAAAALGELADPEAQKALLRTATEVPITRVRRAACDALAVLDAQEAVDELVKKAKGKEPVNALQALTFVGELAEVAFEIKKLDDLATSDDPRVAHWAGRAAVAGARDGSGLGALIALHRNEKNGLVALCGGLDTVAAAPSEKNVAIVQGLALDPNAVDVVSLRALRAMAAALDLTDSAHNLGLVTSGLDPRRGADLAWMVLQRMDTSELESSKLAGAREHVLELARRAAGGGGPETRGAGLRVLERLGEEEDLKVVTALLESGAPRNRIRAAKALGRGFDDATWVQAVSARLGNEGDPTVREELCVQLGRRGLDAALVPLTTALEDDEWTVAVCAAVSLGKLNVDGAAQALATLTGARDWKLRGAAAAGYGWLYRAEAMEPLIELLGDRDHSVKRTAYEGLKRLARRGDVPDKQAAWTAWWEENRERFVFRHPADTEEEKQKYGYSDLGRPPTASDYRRLYESFDVLALEGQYDHIQDLLDGIEIPYRLTNASALQRAELHPFSAFFANCTGEVAGDDVDRLAWFVRTGGHMFASCWSLTNTVKAVYPGVISHDESAGEEVVGSIPIFPVDPQSRFLPGVFPKDVRPYFHLEGSQLITVDRPEVAEVLIDSPAAAQTYGNGNVVAWFEAGHGMVLDSANHFYIHGFEWMPGLKDADDFQHYALNHMGLEFDRWREIEGESYWRSKSKAAEEVPETCVFNFVTNFVRRYRAGLPR
ncbi:HEAT repeat protein [Planctomycetes bacterium Pla163]|uniref:HEAT repeat protein n=1 Tax=Rohdeia mirabilis TaxID=2528008 RepID=A0A518CWV7_9BACT|nr:HEAT repeat protein [Planctomycetes bacterium Pla163]